MPLQLRAIASAVVLGGAILAVPLAQVSAAPVPKFQVLDRSDVSPKSTAPAPRLRWFDASTSVGKTGAIATYTWRFSDGTNSVTARRPRTRHAFPRFGNYRVTLTVTDADGQSRSLTKRVRIDRPAQLGAPIGPDRARVGEVIGWTVAARPPTTTAQLRALVPRSRRGKPGGNLTKCGSRRKALAFSFRFAGLPSDVETPQVIVTWSRNGRRLTRGRIDVNSNRGRGLFGTFVSAPTRSLANGRYAVTVTYRSRLLVRSYANRTC